MMGRTPLATAACLGAVMAWPAGAAAQGGDFDISRAALNDSTVWVPFLVTGTTPLRQALADRVVDRDTRVLVVEMGGGTLVLVTAQMAYHHLAQGEIAGEPWMVSF